MRLTISRKLILSFLGLTILVLIATLGLARWSFERGFLDYVNALEEARLQTLSLELAEHYSSSGNNWGEITPEIFGDALRTRPAKRPIKKDRPPFSSEQENPTDFPPPPFDSPPPLIDGNEKSDIFDKQRRPPPPGPKRRMPSTPTSLFDLNDQQIIGPPIYDDIEHISVPIVVDDKPVGFLKSAPRRQFESPQETSFSKQQFTTSAFIALFSLLLALIASWLLTRALLSPVQRMIRGVSKLSKGEYSSRLDEKRNDELGVLMTDLDHLALKLDEGRSSRQRWLADISHELRTPITVLTGEIETLKDGIRPFNKEQLISLDQEVARLRHLVDDLYELSVSDIGGLRYTFQETNIQKMLSSMVSATQLKAKEFGIELELTGNINDDVYADEQRLHQLFSNLISNSLAYTNAPGKLHITLESNNSEIILHFIDTPPGATESECKQFFDPLYRQEKSRNRRTAGAGLGLAICKNIVEAHRGKISASPSKHGGIDIKVILPINMSN